MTKIKLFDKDEKNFLSRGLGVLGDASDAVITEVINGVYDMSFFYPLKGRLYESIIPERIVYSKGPKNYQAFRIDSIEKNDMLSGIIVHAMHISYDLAGNFVEDTFVQNRNGDGAIKQLLSKALVPHNFVGTSNIQKTFNSRIVRENLLSVLLGDDDNSFLSRAGGQLERDNFRINWLSSLGEDRGVKIKYRKNLTGLNFLEDYSDVVTKVMPQGFDGLFLPEKYVESPKSANYTIARVKNARFGDIKSKKLSSDEDDAIEHEEAIKLLRKTAKEYIETVDTPTITADVDFVDLSQTEEYKHYKQLESVYIGDTVTIIHEPLGVEFKKQVTSYRYDPIEERYIMLTLGEDIKTLNNAIDQSKKAIKKIENLENELGTSILEKYKKVATDLINSGFGGYTRYYKDRMLVMDTDDEATAIKVWQFNKNGIGYSKTGIQGPYVYAWTIDGVFNTDFIGVNSITVNQLASDVGQSLDISSNGSIISKVSTETYEADNIAKNERFSAIEQTANSIALKVEEKGKYKNYITNSDNFYKCYVHAYTGSDISIKKGDYATRNSDNSLELIANKGEGTYRFRILLDNLKKIENYTLWIGKMYIPTNINSVVMRIVDEKGYWYTNQTSNIVGNSDNNTFFMNVRENNNANEDLKFLEIDITVDYYANVTNIRLYPEKIALVEGKILNKLDWSMTYMGSSSAFIQATKDEILAHAGEAFIKVEARAEIDEAINSKTSKDYVDSAVSQISLRGDKITLTGDTNIEGTFKVSSGNIADIAGWELSNTRISKKTTSGSHLVFLNSDRGGNWPIGVFRYVNGAYNENIFSVAWDGTLKAEKAEIKGTINAISGTIGGWNISPEGLSSGGGTNYIRLSAKEGYAPLIAGGTSWDSAKTKISTSGVLYSTGAVIDGKVTATSGNIGGFKISNNTLYGGSGSSYIRLSGASGIAPIIAGGTSWDSAKFGVSTSGIVKSREGSYGGSHTGSADFSSGSYVGEGYFNGGRLAGVGFGRSDNGDLFLDGSLFLINSESLHAHNVKTYKITGAIPNSQGIYPEAILKSSGWEISNSDIRLKENIEELTHEYDKFIYDLPLIKYTYIGDEKHRPQVGVNANLLMKVLPEDMANSFLHQDENTGLYGANYELLVPYLIKTIQDLNERLKRLEKRLYDEDN